VFCPLIELNHIQPLAVRVLEVGRFPGVVLAYGTLEFNPCFFSVAIASSILPASSKPIMVDPFLPAGFWFEAGCRPIRRKTSDNTN
jgi:hypothetical protein